MATGQPPSQADPFGGQGPFNKYLDPTQQAVASRPQWDNGQQFNGYEGGLGKTLGIFNKFAEGLTQGRVHAFAMKEKEKHDNWAALENYAKGVHANPKISDVQKAELDSGMTNLWAKQIQPDLNAAQKDKGTAGHVAKFFGGVVDRMAGGPYKSGEPWDVKDILGLVAKTTPKMESVESTVNYQFDKVHQAFQDALPGVLARVQKTGNNVVTREDLIQDPAISKTLRDAGDISAGSKETIQGLINAYPSGENPQIKARLEAAYMLNNKAPEQQLAPPSTRAESGMMPLAQGRLEQLNPAPPAPVESVVRIPGQNDPAQQLPMSRVDRELPPPTAAEIESKKRYDELLLLSGIKQPVSVTAMNPFTRQFESGVTPEQSKTWTTEWARILGEDKEKDIKANRARIQGNVDRAFVYMGKNDTENRALRKQNTAIAGMLAGISQGRLDTDNRKLAISQGTLNATSKLMTEYYHFNPTGTVEGFADGLPDILRAHEGDPEFDGNSYEISNYTEHLKKVAKGQPDWLQLLNPGQPGAAAKGPAPPVTRRSAAAGAQAVHPTSAGIAGKLGLGTSAPAPAPAAGGVPAGYHKQWNGNGFDIVKD